MVNPTFSFKPPPSIALQWTVYGLCSWGGGRREKSCLLGERRRKIRILEKKKEQRLEGKYILSL